MNYAGDRRPAGQMAGRRGGDYLDGMTGTYAIAAQPAFCLTIHLN